MNIIELERDRSNFEVVGKFLKLNCYFYTVGRLARHTGIFE